MKKHVLLTIAACGGMLMTANVADAQEAVVVGEEITVTETPCVTHYYNTWRDGWFLQAGAGIDVPYVEDTGTEGRHITAVYNLGVGRWFSPYMGFRFSGYYGAIHYYNQGYMNRAKSANLNLDFMWDMFNSIGGVNPNRPVSLIPYVGLGGAYTWDFDAVDENVRTDGGASRPIHGHCLCRPACSCVSVFANMWISLPMPGPLSMAIISTTAFSANLLT